MSRSWLGVAGLALSASAMSSSSRKRRNSGGGAPGSKAMKAEAITDLKVPVDALLKSHVKLFDQWLMLGYCQCNNDIATCHECESHVFDSLGPAAPRNTVTIEHQSIDNYIALKLQTEVRE